MNAHAPLPPEIAARAELSCMVSTVDLLAHHQIHLPTEHVGLKLRFADGTSARVYRETVVEGAANLHPCVLLVEFRLRFVRGLWHTVFRWESLANTPLFVGFPGFVSKLWLAHDERNVYRGIYDWDEADRAEHYARSLWQVLALGCEPGSIHYKILPGLRRDEVLSDPHVIDGVAPEDARAWWRPISVT